jgi:trans-aconitate methyltransferase
MNSRMVTTSDYYSILRDEIAPLLPSEFKTVMDVGCGTGVTSKWIKERFPSVCIVGLEVNPIVADAARRVIGEVINTDIERDDVAIAKYDEQIDVLLLMDVLEHLQDPWNCLSRLRNLLSPSGIVIASIPNVRNFKVTLPLVLKGQWQYQGAGILDRTHLRFFTRSSIKHLFAHAGYAITSITTTGPVKFSRVRSIAGFAACTANFLTVGLLKDFIVHQFLVVARLEPNPTVTSNSGR